MLGFYFRIVLCQLMLGRLSSMSLNDGNKTATISNTTNLLYQFFLLCGPEYFCHPEKLTFGFDIIKTRHTEICADCRCDRDCTTNGNCCVDVIFSLTLPVCVDSSIADGQVFHLSNDVFMTNSCLSNTVNDTWRGLCETNDIVFKAGRVEFPPVTSRRYRQTFKNKFCAECNGVFDYNEWSLSMTCPELTDFNFYSSFDEIFEKVDSEDCGVGFSTIDDDMHKCDRDFVDVLSRSKCNVTGAWVTYDQDIDLACNSIYSLRHGLYTNIFCFMCNPPAYNDNVISSCNVTGLWNQRMDSLERACEVHAKSPNTVPYKNIFCFLCNRNNSHSSPYFDVYTDKMTEDIHFRSSNGKLTFVYKFLFTSYNVDYYDTIVSSTQTQNSGKSEKGATDKWSVNTTNLLLYDYSVTGYYRGCQQPYSIGNYSCTCNPVCFVDTSLNCCLDIALEYSVSCQRPNISTYGPNHYFINGCSQTNSIDVVQSRCLLSHYDIYSTIPVSGRNKVLYKNFDCFICNQNSRWNSVQNVSADSFLPWSIDMQCEEDLNLRYHTTMYDVINFAKRIGCILETSSKGVVSHETCKHSKTSSTESIINKCNITGHWSEFDPDILWACEESSLQNQYDLYRNVFCFICNPLSVTNTTKPNKICPTVDNRFYDACQEAPEVISMSPYGNIFCLYCTSNDSKIPFPQPITFKMHLFERKIDIWFSHHQKIILQNLFQPFVSQVVQDPVEMNDSHIFDPIVSRRRLLSCYPGKVLDGSECFPLLRTTTRLKYILAFSLEGTIDSTKQTLFADTRLSVLSEIKKRLSLEELYIISFHIMSNISCDINNLTESKGVHLLIQTTFTIVKVIERLQTEQTLLNLIKQNFVISEVSFISRPASEAYLLPSVPGSNFNGYCVQKVLQAYKSWITLPSIRAILVSEVLTCRHVVLDPEEYSIKLETLELTLKYTSKKFHQDKFLRMPDHSVQLCLNDYLEILDEYTASTKDDTFRQALSVTTLVCTAASLLFLFITFCTYSLFRAMRSVPGVNNMSLVFAMFFSQAFFQFGFDKTSHASLCKSIGVFTHYFWLATFACMNICTYHMYSVFATSTLTARHRNVRKTITTYILYSYGTPALVVLVNIITSYVISRVDDVNSGFTEIGYGGGSCFISNKVSLYVTFLAPVVLICIINLFMFIRVAIQIRSTPKVESTKAQRLDFVIYVKLFSITGITWIFLIIDSFFPLSVFSFIVTFLTGFQGLAIFSSFVWNNRVFSLYKALCLKRNNTSSSKYSTQSVEVVSSSM